MNRKDFMQVVKSFSDWRKGNYRLPGGEYLSDYLEALVLKLLSQNALAFRADGHIGELINGKIFKPFDDDETTTPEQQDDEICAFVAELIY